MANTQDIFRRIKSVKNTHQITRAMELVAATKMRKAQESALASRTYANLAWDLIKRLSAKADPRIHKLLHQSSEIKKVAIALITSNRGLIGAFNNNIISEAVKFAKQFDDVYFITLGKKGRDSAKKLGYEIVAEFEKQDNVSSVSEIAPLSKLLINDFIEGKYDKVVLVYMDFVSILKQEPHVRELLPLTAEQDETLGKVGQKQNNEAYEAESALGGDWEYKFEPTPDEVLETLLPRLVEMQIYQAVLETNASEHSARMVAMKNASEAANDLIDELNLEYNQLRQANITKEISEIVGGRLALEKG